MHTSVKKWLIQATGGLVLTGAGLSMAVDAGFQKYAGHPWIMYGTVALIVFNSGLCLVVDADKYRPRAK